MLSALTFPRRRHSPAAWMLPLLLAAQVLTGMAWAQSFQPSVHDRKLDAPLRAFALQPEGALRFYDARVKVGAGLKKSAASGRLPVLIRIAAGADEGITMAALRLAGANVHSRLGPIATAEVPIRAVGALAALESVVSMELARPLVSRLNISVPSTGAATLRSGAAPNWSGLTGKGVIVGVVDDGIDFRHRDFRNLDGTTRLLALWDQRDAGTSGQPPAGQAYGGECTVGMLNAAIAGDAEACKQPSSGGHGTHVGGIAAGNGAASGGSQAQYRFTGMAPEADILSANALNTELSLTKGVLDAIAWMKARAAAAGKPLVVNLSLGSYFGARDGTSNFEQGLTAATASGVIIVAAAGNEGNVPVRASGPLAQGGQLAFDVSIPADSTRKVLEVWYPGTDLYSVTIQGPDCAVTQELPATAPTAQVETDCGRVGAINSAALAANDDRQVEVVMMNGTAPLKAGTWRVTFIGTQVAAGTATVSAVSGEAADDMTIVAVNGEPLPPLVTHIITDAASAKGVIGVAALNSNYAWQTAQGQFTGEPFAGAVGDLSSYSSRGPRRMCSNPAKCPQVMKPEITAPGTMIMAALAADHTPKDATTVEIDGVHLAQNGTSMATPHVTGAVALMLQRKPTLTSDEVRQLLYTNVQTTSFTPAVPVFTGADVPANPNHDWGYGILDVAKAVAAIPPDAPAAVLTAFEFLYQPENRYFLTIDPNEAVAIDNGGAGVGWLRTGFTFKAFATTGSAPGGALPVCRFYGSVSPGPNSHFFTASAAECQALKDLQATTPNTQKRWNYEGIAFRLSEPGAGRICAAGLVPVMRAYNNGFTRGIDSNHRFSTSQAEIQSMVAQGWSDEGAVFCSPQ
ncbi:MAG: S8 family serine peptidase [Burkholderiales bacterium]|nr:S8 family serine peptidase [Burkholderiales bacterium]